MRDEITCRFALILRDFAALGRSTDPIRREVVSAYVVLGQDQQAGNAESRWSRAPSSMAVIRSFPDPVADRSPQCDSKRNFSLQPLDNSARILLPTIDKSGIPQGHAGIDACSSTLHVLLICCYSHDTGIFEIHVFSTAAINPPSTMMATKPTVPNRGGRKAIVSIV